MLLLLPGLSLDGGIILDRRLPLKERRNKKQKRNCHFGKEEGAKNRCGQEGTLKVSVRSGCLNAF